MSSLPSQESMTASRKRRSTVSCAGRLFSVSVVVRIGTLVFAVALVSLAGVYLARGTPSAGKSVRTPWGAPDLQGIWSQQTDTPLERPARYGQREFLTEDELAARNKELAARPPHSLYRDARKERGTEADVAGAYNAVFQGDRPNKSGRRTSLVVDPPDGRIPALTPDSSGKCVRLPTCRTGTPWRYLIMVAPRVGRFIT